MSNKIFNPQVSYIELGIIILGFILVGFIIFICSPISSTKMLREIFRKTKKQ